MKAGDGSMPYPLIELAAVGKEFPESATSSTRVLRNVSFTIDAGEFVAIMGPSGSGKSTLMNILGLLDHPSDGSYRINGRDVTSLTNNQLAAHRRQTFGFIFQQYRLITSMTAIENVEMPAAYAGDPKDRRRDRASWLLGKLGLASFLHYYPGQLSGGQQQRVSIARALVNGGQVILADEPTGALDSETGGEVIALLSDLAMQGHTVILITHDRKTAQSARRIIEIHDGNVITDTRQPSQNATTADKVALSANQVNSPVATIRSNVTEAFKSGARGLRANPFRTFLTLLGVIIGVASVATLMAIGEGARRDVLDRMAVYGAGRIYVVPGGERSRGAGGRLLASDVDLVRTVTNVSAAIPYLAGRVTVRAGNVDYLTTAAASTDDFPMVQSWQVDRGRFFTNDDNRKLATVAVVGAAVASRLFPVGSDPLQQIILIQGVPFQIIGVFAVKGGDGTGTNNDDSIVVPQKTGQIRLFGTQELTWISLIMENIHASKDTEDDIKNVLNQAHGGDDFRVLNQAAYIDAETKTQDTLKLLLTSTAAISLIVGGIGIMNVMLMAVAERTREIGIRIAGGARTLDILIQFLTEAVTMTVFGGLLGLVLGLAAGAVAAFGFGVPVIFTGVSLAGALISAILMGLIFGFAPALRAARLKPVTALARE
ncbi:ATP-binding cassette domain-containing protein [Rhizobium sp. VS19-DR104.2]|uniref:ABC transporter permease n=1 Tax=unclassified Rhizobium TaxID=2613769 RepID=UPI001C5BB44B|nr:MULTISPECIES: ABC transporter permease [unclassified Rhizobium]MBZ5763773.1 ATP-binding cassette domain-containing protein [Rhizobium sp. VS19-DR96]MBZ5769712.1 ATP-binding cassette domain-containing protein [Rhizobium sp. VS19-DR129.2]MBZ5777254.1 ATP-binding cassette domain-containing protein [Rhizobium sp. VS19-DRK62.2]MBZ5788377.1 ATP-binding cassette domain-containing protein [Rhizobium sp. VS19-DR121]MBZ5805826.1 ATP-binding cassette domain-containing protein [Rhizobium sp. VS19-DR181